ncbi:hypothetical protein LCGC14_2540670 [marine sediment metagenome]|uniref:Uncharacterized protein n=1 Tax=marine sediment metagenome TaxID=412755 RepID=A0A0F9BDK7_9ZZZZ
MKRQEAVQYQADHVGVIEGTDADFGMPLEAACEDCGGMVDLTAEITVQIMNHDGSKSEERMTEANARQLLLEVGTPPPPVMCDHHEEVVYG